MSRFAAYITAQDAEAQAMDAVTPELAAAFLETEEKRGVTAKTWNDTLKLLRATFKHLRRAAGIVDNPFDGIPTKETETVFRKPFTPEELNAIVQAAQDDAYIPARDRHGNLYGHAPGRLLFTPLGRRGHGKPLHPREDGEDRPDS